MTITHRNVGIYVDGWWGQYGVARAVWVLRNLGWEPEDAKTIDALAMTMFDSMGGNTTLSSTTREARITAGLPDIAETPDLGEFDQISMWLTHVLDDGEAWANSVAEDGLYVGWEDGEFGIFAIEEEETL